jgi:hypothetical protein
MNRTESACWLLDGSKGDVSGQVSRKQPFAELAAGKST